MQWMLRITQYADRLVEDLDNVDWSDSIKDMQRNWIGRSQVRLQGGKIELFSDHNRSLLKRQPGAVRLQKLSLCG